MRTLLLTIFILSLTIGAKAQNEWEKLEAFGGAKRERAVGFAIGNRGYVGCGQDTAEVMRRDFWEFDPGTNSWTQKADFGGIGRRNAVGFAIGNKGYIGTGIDNSESFMGNSLSDFWEFDPATNTWTQKSPFPFALYYATGFGINGKGYICGGKFGPSNYSSQLYEYNPATNTWTVKAAFPGGVRYGLTSFVINNKAYVGLGADENVYTTDIWCYDPVSGFWSQKANFPGSGRFSVSTFALGVRGYVALGSDGGYKNELFEYNSLDNSWTQRADFDGGARRSAVGFSIGNKGYTGTGKGYSGCRRDFWEYTPAPLTGIDDLKSENAVITFYPNPLTVSATFVLPAEVKQQHGELELQLFDSNGREVRREAIDPSHPVIEREYLASGIYFCSLRNDGKMIAHGKLIVQ
jgi:N-acetylneuraminic acid mutarotase